MLKLKFAAGNKMIIEQLQNSSFKKYSNLFTEDGLWLQNASTDEMRELACLINSLDIDPIEVEIIGHEDIHFTYDDILKKVFLYDLSGKWELEQSVRYAINAIVSAEEFEIKFNKSLLQFNREEAEEAARGIFSDMRYFGLKFKLNTFDKMQKFYTNYLDMGENEDVWSKVQESENLNDILNNDEKEPVTREELFTLFNIMTNMQDSIIPILIFEGAKYNRTDELDELRYLKQTDVGQNKLTLRAGGEEGSERFIEIESEVESMINKVMTQKYMIRNRFHKNELIDLANTEYILKPMIGGRTKEDFKDSISYRGTYNRFLTCKEQFESAIGKKNFTPKNIEQCGKTYYVSKFVEEGVDLPEALRMTCKRFGDWTYLEDESKENGLQANRQRVTRLKKIWGVYGNVASVSKRV